jgi:hypothetical protein
VIAYHVGRSWTGHDIEDNCPCPKAPCGLVDVQNVADECEHHPVLRAKSMRQGHPAEDCPTKEEN